MSIMAGDRETGVMVMRMEEGLDTGPVLMAERTMIGRKTYGELHDRLARLGADLMVRAIAALERDSAQERPQAEYGVTYARKISKEETRIDWAKPAVSLDCLIRGLSPQPGAWCAIWCRSRIGGTFSRRPRQVDLDFHFTSTPGDQAIQPLSDPMRSAGAYMVKLARMSVD